MISRTLTGQSRAFPGATEGTCRLNSRLRPSDCHPPVYSPPLPGDEPISLSMIPSARGMSHLGRRHFRLASIFHHGAVTVPVRLGASRCQRRMHIFSSPSVPTSKSHNTSLATAISFEDDTIYALSSGPGRAGIAVIRVSGPACVDVSQAPNPRSIRF